MTIRFAAVTGLFLCTLFAHAEWKGDFWVAEPNEIKKSGANLDTFVGSQIDFHINEPSVTDGCKWYIQFEKESKNKAEIVFKDDSRQNKEDRFEIRFLETGMVKFRLVYANMKDRKDIRQIVNYKVNVQEKPEKKAKTETGGTATADGVNADDAESAKADKPTAAADTKKDDCVWHIDYEEAKEIAEKEKKLILLLFTSSDRGGACAALDEKVLQTREFKEYAKQHLILVKLDYPQKVKQPQSLVSQNEFLKFQYHPKVFPCTFIIDYSERQRGVISGNKEDYLDIVKRIVSRSK